MKKTILIAATASALALAGCMDMSASEQRQTQGAVVGGAVGLIGAKALGANTEWTVVSTLAGAAAGAMVAQNTQTGECAYANGDGTYRTGPCP
ncbi:glycine zipper 2TM domain-containing protein [Rhodalgimonas zhirmunskyi]|uniref:17 kDa surface antigen n=1 Tax=Rhodalgimonas zhirmunskyi TaxID=2964767 RepID=A0AAJ1UCE7_9RHOB|nr:glycine zipper 2TM domain-containing protein [Rhodoalgimonas zhirmunskyi]MDQ2095323.1 glycine zipper 2TM domain-containing protein [Rhodoalgimonas zhirmunskyi]